MSAKLIIQNIIQFMCIKLRRLLANDVISIRIFDVSHIKAIYTAISLKIITTAHISAA